MQRLFDLATDGLDADQLRRVEEGLSEDDRASCRMVRARELHLALKEDAVCTG